MVPLIHCPALCDDTMVAMDDTMAATAWGAEHIVMELSECATGGSDGERCDDRRRDVGWRGDGAVVARWVASGSLYVVVVLCYQMLSATASRIVIIFAIIVSIT